MKEVRRLLSFVSDRLLNDILIELRHGADDDHLLLCLAWASRERRGRNSMENNNEA